jgi:hypothetical protein
LALTVTSVIYDLTHRFDVCYIITNLCR